MRLIKIRLKGFTGILKGMGREEIEIDFSNLEGLIAIAGPNGAGKTTILDSMQPFRTLASRKRSLQHHVFRRDSEKELEFDFNGDHYRSLIKIDAESDRSEGYLWKNGESLVDGKVTNYDQEITRLFGSPELFFNSVFCAQNSKKLNEMTTGELKKLFSEFLRLDKLIDYENTSKQCALILSSKLDALETRIDQLTQTTGDKEDTVIKLGSATTQLEMALANSQKLQEELSTKEAELHGAQAAIQKNAILLDREKELQAERDALIKDIDELNRMVEREMSDMASQISSTEVNIAIQESLMANEKEIRGAVNTVAGLNRQIEEVKKLGQSFRKREVTLKKECDKELEEFTSVSSQLQKFQQETTDTENRIKNRTKNCKEKMADLDKKDPECTSTTCSFIIGALQAKEELPRLECDLSEWQTTRRIKEDECKLEVENSQKGLDDINVLIKINDKAINDLSEKYNNLDGKIKKLQPLANDLPKVEIATQRKADLAKRAEELRKQCQNGMDTAKTQKEALRQKRLSIDAKLDETQKQIDKGAEERVVNIRKRSEELTTVIKAYNDKALPALKADITAYGRRLEEIEIAENEWEKAKVQADRYKVEIGGWTYLKNACSKDGLRALEIDSIAPVITGYANELLLATFGPTFSVRFRTQDEETLKEILEILVITEDGSEVLLDSLSGGEKIWILQSLRLAMTLISKEKSGKNFLSGFSDELDGPLDVNRAVEFAQMYRAFMASGGFESFYFISHKPETITLADHVVNLPKAQVGEAYRKIRDGQANVVYLSDYLNGTGIEVN